MTTLADAKFYNPEMRQLSCKGDWNLTNLSDLQALFKKITWPRSGEVIFSGKATTQMDSAGAWLLLSWKNELEKQGLKVKFQDFTDNYHTLIAMVEAHLKTKTVLAAPVAMNRLAKLGKNSIQQLREFLAYLAFIGKLTVEVLRLSFSPSNWRWNSLSSVVYRNGYQALPIIALLAFMIGVVITYQMGLQLRNYGGNIYIVDLLGLSILREFSPLLTAIMVAGRTGSSFTAQLGIMKINQEIDALNTLGVTPAELLLLPRMMGLFIALPLLTMWADIFGVMGGMLMSANMLNISWYDFLHRFPHVIPLKTLIIGLGKAPVFALIIASIGCFQGVKVERNANSVGLNTTRSVVLAIFFIILADAAFSVVFSKLKL